MFSSKHLQQIDEIKNDSAVADLKIILCFSIDENMSKNVTNLF